MHVKELSREESLRFLSRQRLGRLGCAKESQPYVTPIFFIYHDPFIYSFSTIGQKIQWLRVNPLACLEVDEIRSPQHWTSVIVLGRYDEIPSTAKAKSDRDFAHELLQRTPMWWEPGYVRSEFHGAPRPMEPVYFRLTIEEISGHEATPAD